MRIVLLAVALAGAGCVVPQPESARTVAAYDVPLPTARDRQDFVQIMDRDARAAGFHVDAASDEELRDMSTVYPIRLDATVWRGDDVEVVASAMDMVDHVGRAWISFAKGEDPQAFARFRAQLMADITRRWPQTTSLPILPGGNIPLARDLVRTPSGYRLKPSERTRYEAKP